MHIGALLPHQARHRLAVVVDGERLTCQELGTPA
jgi:hypothetical protein